MNKFLSVFMAMIVLAGLAYPGSQGRAGQVMTVTTTADEIHADGLCSLREAIQAANDGEPVDACQPGPGPYAIELPAGLYTLAISGVGENANRTGDLDLAASLTLSGAGRDQSVIDAAGIDRVLQISGGVVVTLKDLTLRGGSPGAGSGPAYSGGAIALVAGNVLHLENVRVAGSAAATGGGIYNNGGSLTLSGSLVEGNTATYAGGIYNGGSLALTASSVRDNQSSLYGGGIQSLSQLSVDASTVSGNHAGTNGGGVYISSGAATLANSTISGNGIGTGFMGGGIWVYYQAQVTLTHVTLSDSLGGYGIYNYHEGPGVGDEEPNIHFQNSLVAASSPQNCGRSPNAPPMGSLGYNLDSGSTCGFNAPGDLSSANPGLHALANNGGATQTCALPANSPAVDAAGDQGCLPTDQRSLPRPVGRACDMGAFEYAPGAENLLFLPALFRAP